MKRMQEERDFDPIEPVFLQPLKLARQRRLWEEGPASEKCRGYS